MVKADLTDAWDSTRVLENPDKGWYHHMLDAGIGKYLIQDEELFHSFPGMDHLYLRLAWAYLEPEKGVYNWEVIDTIIDKYVPMGYGISFRVSCKETGWAPNSIPEVVDGIGYATPSWVRKEGASGVIPEHRSPVWTPDWDDPVFLEKLDNFPDETAAGAYRLGMKLQKETPGIVRDVHMAVSKSLLDQDNFLTIGEVGIR